MPAPSYPTRWETNAVTVAGGTGEGNEAHQLWNPAGLFVDENRTVYIAEQSNDRVVAWNANAKTGKVLAGGNGQGDRLNQLKYATDVIVERETDSLLVCDRWNQRVIRWSHRSSISLRQGEIVIDNIYCYGLTMDDQGSLYVSNTDKHEVRRYDKDGDKNGTVVAGGYGEGTNLNELNVPTYLFVDAEFTLYVSDNANHRVMKWIKGAKEGIVVAGGNGNGGDLRQLSHPTGVWLDGREHLYVADSGNHRVMRWEKGAKQGTVIVGGNGSGEKANQFSHPFGLFFDRQGNLYVSDNVNNRVQRFSAIIE